MLAQTVCLPSARSGRAPPLVAVLTAAALRALTAAVLLCSALTAFRCYKAPIRTVCLTRGRPSPPRSSTYQRPTPFATAAPQRAGTTCALRGSAVWQFTRAPLAAGASSWARPRPLPPTPASTFRRAPAGRRGQTKVAALFLSLAVVAAEGVGRWWQRRTLLLSRPLTG